MRVLNSGPNGKGKVFAVCYRWITWIGASTAKYKIPSARALLFGVLAAIWCFAFLQEMPRIKAHKTLETQRIRAGPLIC
ncbi:MAG: hypothetical protein COA52_02085 [Hyphomicrobiales bacterium]|nr:MAG: hypothetical protein COA52_02085 [Hyphomicrobiales bacterium]